MGASSRKVSVVPCGVDLETFRPDGPAEPRRPDRRHRLVVISRLVERKGIADALVALRQLPDVELVIAGGPERDQLEKDPEASRLMRIAAEAGVKDRVDFRGGLARADVPPLMRSADVVVSVPWYEPFGIVPVEAMACGVPVVGAAVGGLIDTIVDGKTGFHVPPRDPERLASTLRALLDDDSLRRRLGQAGAQRAAENYGHDQVAAATLACYRRAIGSRQLRARTAWMSP
jgi:glycosyltransferase involved in cell wall biosynthesis